MRGATGPPHPAALAGQWPRAAAAKTAARRMFPADRSRSTFFLEAGAAAPAGDGNFPLAPGNPELLAAVGTFEIAVILIPVDGAPHTDPL